MPGVVTPERLVEVLDRYRTRAHDMDASVQVSGSLVRTVGLVMEARGIIIPLRPYG